MYREAGVLYSVTSESRRERGLSAAVTSHYPFLVKYKKFNFFNIPLKVTGVLRLLLSRIGFRIDF